MIGARRDACLFAYGTLMFPPIFTAVTGREGAMRPAVLAGYARLRVRDTPYPALVAAAAASTEGLLSAPLDLATWQRLDEFEGSFYDRITVSVALADGRTAAAQTYVATARGRHRLSTSAWLPDAFAAEHLDSYVRRLKDRA